MDTETQGGANIAAALDPSVASLLRLQDADARRQQLETQLKQVPAEMAGLERRVAEEKEAHEARKRGVQEIEVKRKDADNRLKLAEAAVLKYKTQQIEVRKNDEYQALSHQIATAEAEVGALETAELEFMLQLDDAKEALRLAEAQMQRRLTELADETALVRRREAQLRTDFSGQTGAVEDAATAVPVIWRRAYETAKGRVKRAPYVAPLEDHRCGGCHLRVSNEVAEAAKRFAKPVQCDSCGRVVYWVA